MGGAGDDTLLGGNADDTLIGGNGTDRKLDDANDVPDVDLSWGQTDNDTLYAGPGNNQTLRGGVGDDVIYTGTGLNDALYGGDGEDRLVVLGSVGNDVIRVDPGQVTETSIIPIQGRPVTFESSTSYLYFESVDIQAGPGDDSVVSSILGTIPVHADGGPGTNSLVILGDENPNTFTLTEDGSDVAVNGDASVTTSGFWSLTIDGGPGDDVIDANALSASHPVTLLGGPGNDTINGGAGNDFIRGGDDNETADDNDTVQGFGGDDTIFGGAGDDSLYGGDGTDTIDGGPGSDYLNATGNDSTYDILYYSDGSDRYQGQYQDPIYSHDQIIYRASPNDTILAFGKGFLVNGNFKPFGYAYAIETLGVETGGAPVDFRVGQWDDLPWVTAYSGGWDAESALVDVNYSYTGHGNQPYSTPTYTWPSAINERFSGQKSSLDTVNFEWGTDSLRMYGQTSYLGSDFLFIHTDGTATLTGTIYGQRWNPNLNPYQDHYYGYNIYGLWYNKVTNVPGIVLSYSDISVEATGPDGAVVDYPPATAGGTVPTSTVTYSIPSGTTFPIGLTTVVATTSAPSNNSSPIYVPLGIPTGNVTILPVGPGTLLLDDTTSVVFQVTVRDTTPPTIQPLTNITISANDLGNAKASFALPLATDLVDPNPVVTTSIPSGSLFHLGVTPVVVTATDMFGNSSSRTFLVTVTDTKGVSSSLKSSAVDPQGRANYALKTDGSLWKDQGTNRSLLDSNVTSLELSNGGALYWLRGDGKLSQDGVGVVDTNVKSFSIDSDGAVYVLHGDATLTFLNGATIASNVLSFSLSEHDTLYVLGGDGVLSRFDVGPIESDVRSFAPGPDGTLYILKGNGDLQMRGNQLYVPVSAGDHTEVVEANLDSDVVSFAVASDGALYELRNDGGLFARTPDGTWKSIGTGFQSMVFDARSDTAYGLNGAGEVVAFNRLTSPNGAKFNEHVQSIALDAQTGTLFALTTTGDVKAHKAFSSNSSWTTIRSGVVTIALDDQTDTLYALTTAGVLISYNEVTTGANWNQITDHQKSIGLNPRTGTLYLLSDTGTIATYNPVISGNVPAPLGESTWSMMVVDPLTGAVYGLSLTGQVSVFKETPQGGNWNPIRDGALSLALDPRTGRLFSLNANGEIATYTPQTDQHWTTVGNGFVSMVLANRSGTIYGLNSNGQVLSYNEFTTGMSWQAVDVGVQAIAFDAKTGTLYSLKATWSSNGNPDFGQAVTFTAVVSVPGPGEPLPTGTITFMDGGKSLGTAKFTTAAGVTQASFTSSSLSVGTHVASVAYGGLAVDLPRTVPLLGITVEKDATTNVVTTATPTPVVGQSITLVSTVSVTSPGAGTPSGSVDFFDGAKKLGTASIVVKNGVATASFLTSPLELGTHSFTATYFGDSNDVASDSSPLSLTVGQASSLAFASAASTSINYGDSATLYAAVKFASPGSGYATGTVTFMDGSTKLSTRTLGLSKGVVSVSLVVANFKPGLHSITVVYAGDANLKTSTSPVLNVFVKGPSSVALAASTPSPVVGQALTFTATVSGTGSPTGVVTFMDGATLLGTGDLKTANGVTTASFSTSALAIGAHSLSASYAGDSLNLPSASTTTLVTNVGKADSLAFASAASTSVTFGQTATLYAAVKVAAPGGGIPTGTVIFMDGPNKIDTRTLGFSKGIASVSTTTSSLAVGTHSITITYSGDGNTKAGTSAVLNLVVQAAAKTNSLTAGATAPVPATGSSIAPTVSNSAQLASTIHTRSGNVSSTPKGPAAASIANGGSFGSTVQRVPLLSPLKVDNGRHGISAPVPSLVDTLLMLDDEPKDWTRNGNDGPLASSGNRRSSVMVRVR
ncbi:Ig-like domain repeat protein [Singulisphaera rosea]